jgi:TPR repeat protein
MSPTIPFALAILILSSNGALSGFDEGTADYRVGNYEGAFKEWSDAAQQGDVDAQYNLGCLYVRGEGISQDKTLAADWLQRAADQGDLDAATWLLFSNTLTEDRRKKFFSMRLKPTDRFHLTFVTQLSNGQLHRRPCSTDAENGAQIEFSLGQMYEMGTPGFPQDDRQAAEWYRRASERNFADAQTKLAFLYATGRGVEKDEIEAARLFRKAAEQGDAVAQHSLGIMYASGSFGYTKDLVLAYVLVSHVANEGNELAIRDLQKIRGLLSPDQLVEGQRLAGKWQSSVRWLPELAERMGPPH